MVKGTLKAKPPQCKENGLLNDALHTFDLPTLVEKMKHSNAWLKGDLDAIILLESPEKQIVLTALHAGTEIKSFQSNDSVTFQIIEGNLKFHVRKESVTLEKGQLMTFRETLRCNLTTREETVFLLTIANDLLQQAENQMPWC